MHASAPTEDKPRQTVFRAAQYVRMSTEHQQYSTENQGDKICEYAVRRNLEIVRTYADEGKSGLRIDGRQALQQLIADVQAGKADFQIILVYDVSRWGRFQDADESTYYEYICRRAGIQVVYCAEQFENDGSPVSTIVNGVKRAMAGEYSREQERPELGHRPCSGEPGYTTGGVPGTRGTGKIARNPTTTRDYGQQKTGLEDRFLSEYWWSGWGSNPRPSHCERDALPAELPPHVDCVARSPHRGAKHSLG